MSASATLQTLAQRLHVLQSVEAIESLKARYWRALDRKRPADVEACLHPDAIVDFEGLPRYESREAFMSMVRQAAQSPNTYNMHHGQNPQITMTGENSAEGTWDIFFYGIDLATNTLLQMAGAYTDTYTCENETWLIAATKMRITSLHIQSTTPKLKTLVLGQPTPG